ncbi:ABC-type dipeptide/oligopeptide/nickel transport system permease component [Bradyrhizobium japonicum]
MGRYLAIRIGRAALTIVLVVTFAFVVLRLSGDPALMILGPEAPPEVLAAFRKAWGLDDPIWFQYLDYFGAIAKGELGRSMRDGRPAIELVLERMPPRVTSNSSGCGQSNSSTREAGQGTVSLSLFPGQELQRLL